MRITGRFNMWRKECLFGVSFLLMCSMKNNADTLSNASSVVNNQDFPSTIIALSKKKLPDNLIQKAKTEISTVYQKATLVVYGTVVDTFYSLKSKEKDQGWKVTVIKELKIVKGSADSTSLFVSGLGGLRTLVRDGSIFSLNDQICNKDRCICLLSKNLKLSNWTGKEVYSCLKFVIIK